MPKKIRSRGVDPSAEKDSTKQATLRKQAVLSDYCLGSVHAVAEAGQIGGIAIRAILGYNSVLVMRSTDSHTSKICGHERQVSYLNRVFTRGRMSHAYLFFGPEHAGKRTVAEEIAKTLFCKNAVASGSIEIGQACGACSDCLAVRENRHPRIITLDPARALVSGKEDRKDISIEDIRELRRVFGFAPEDERYRIAIIRRADTMNEAASNALLKMLEEPGSRALFFLITSAPESLLSTIRSRSVGVRFSTVEDERIASFLRDGGISPAEISEIVSYASGLPGLAVEIAGRKDRLREERASASGFKDALRSGFSGMSQLSREAADDRDYRGRLARYVMQELYARMRNVAGAKEIRRAGERMRSVDRLLALMDTTNVNPRMALDAVFLELLSRPFSENPAVLPRGNTAPFLSVGSNTSGKGRDL